MGYGGHARKNRDDYSVSYAAGKPSNDNVLVDRPPHASFWPVTPTDLWKLSDHDVAGKARQAPPTSPDPTMCIGMPNLSAQYRHSCRERA